jgi:CHAD domain-containing protein
MAEQNDPEEHPLAAYLAEQADAALGRLDDVPDSQAIHQGRVAIRRLRSTVRVFAAQLDLTEEQAAEADAELRWIAEVLGEVRDRQVQRRRFIEELAQLGPEDVAPQTVLRVAALIEAVLLTEERAAAQAAEEAVASRRYAALRAMLETWRDQPPVAPARSEKEHLRVIRKAARHAGRKAD